MRQRRVIFSLVLAPAVLAGASWLGLVAMDRRGLDFYHAGRGVVDELDGLAAALKTRDPAAIGRFFDAGYKGEALGLDSLGPAAEKDGVRVARFGWFGPRGAAAPPAEDRDAALVSWESYLAGFSSVDELGLHLDRLDEWSGDELVGRARFELIGTPRGAAHAGIDRAYFRLRLARRKTPEGGLTIVGAALDSGERVIGGEPQFVDVAHAAGVDFLNRVDPGLLAPMPYGLVRYGGSGITAVDYDNDGLYDLFIPDGVASKLLRNRGDGTFEDVTEKAGLGGLAAVSVGVFADYDNDGYKDLFVSHSFGGASQLFHNNGDGTFTDVTAHSGLNLDDCCAYSASWADYDNDGYLDLYVGRYIDPRVKAPNMIYSRNGEGNRLYHNNRDGTFTDVTAKAGVGDTGLCLAVAWGDYDGDGYPDLFVVNDFGRSTLYHNQRDGTFQDVSVAAHALVYGAGMNASFADYDNDGKLDLYSTDIRSEHAWFAALPSVERYVSNSLRQGAWRTDLPLFAEIFRQSGFDFTGVFHQMAAGNHLLHNRGDGTFEEVTQKAGADPVGWFWGAAFADFDNDGWLDVYAADGWIYNQPGTEIELDFYNNSISRLNEFKQGMFFDPERFANRSWHGWERNRYLRNRGDGTFEEIGRGAGIDLLTNSRGVAVADFWNRGVVDIAVAALSDRHALLRNEVGGRRHWLEVELTGTRSNRDAVGARVSIVAGGKPQMREVAAGDGYASQSALRLHFGLGDAAAVDEMTVRWPASGIFETFHGVAADRIVTLKEGSGQLVEAHYRSVQGGPHPTNPTAPAR
jgi:hypothetical protein